VDNNVMCVELWYYKLHNQSIN